jgi:hypothetical protein
LTCQDEFFINNPLDVKENDEHALGYALRLSRFLGLGYFRHPQTARAFFIERLLIIVRALVALSPRSARN